MVIRRSFFGSIFTFFFIFLSLTNIAYAETAAPVADAVASAPDEAQRLRISASYGKVPLYFIENNGQVDASVAFYEKGAGHATYFTKDGVYMSLVKKDGADKKTESAGSLDGPPKAIEPGNFKSEFVKLSFVGANANPEIVALDEQAGKVNYFVGDNSKWRTDIKTFGAVLYREVYKGIDVKFYGNNQKLEYDVVVKPGADPKIVKLVYEGIEGLKVTDAGDIEVALKSGSIFHKRPYIYQEAKGEKVEIAGAFQILDEKSFGFEVASYDATKELVIDPYLAYSTYMGGGGDDYFEDIAVDSSGNAYVTGETASP